MTEQHIYDDERDQEVRRLSIGITNLWVVLSKISLSQHPSLSKVSEAITAFHDDLQSMYEGWFPNGQFPTEDHISSRVFNKQFVRTQARDHYKSKLAALILSADRHRKRITQRWRKTGFDGKVLAEILMLKEISFEAIPFIDEAEFWITGKSAYSGSVKRTVLFSTEIFEASKAIIRSADPKSNSGDFVFAPTSIFLIRQSIELRLKNALGLSHLRRPDGKFLRLPFETIWRLLDVIKNDIRLPIPIQLIKSIYKWTNPYIHLGWTTYTWEIEWAHHTLQPLFSGKKRSNGSWSLFGSIMIRKRTYNSLADELKKLLSKQGEFDVVRLTRPESVFFR
jgi:hypothetical protein